MPETALDPKSIYKAKLQKDKNKMPDLTIKNAKLVLPDGISQGGIVIEGGKIKAIKNDSNLPDSSEVLDVKGNYVLPGLIDAHVHFREPGASSKEDWKTGSSAAAAGGITTVLDMPNTQPPTTTIEDLEEKRKIAASKSVVDYGFHFGASTENLEELKKLTGGIASVKFYMSSTIGNLMVGNDAIFYEELKALAVSDMLATIHAENKEMVEYLATKLQGKGREDPLAYADSRPAICAAEATNRAIFLSSIAETRIHLCHISTAMEVDLIRKYKGSRPITAEASSHHLFLTREEFNKLGAYAKTNPPLRTKEDQRALWEGINSGVIGLIASDHAPHLPESKEKGIWKSSAGVPGVETLLPLLLNEVNKGTLSLEMVARLTAENPARIFGIKDKGRIEEGYDADLTVIDLEKESTIKNEELFTKCGWSPFNGWKLKGQPIKTIVRGNIIFDQGNINETPGMEVQYA